MRKSLCKKVLILLFFFSKNFIHIDAATLGPFGSEASPSIVYPFGLLTANNATNIIKAYGYAKPGFSLTNDGTTTCTWQSVFPVSGPISLNNGTMYMESDLKLTNTGTLATPGNFYGGYHALKLSQSTNALSLGSLAATSQTLNLISRVSTPTAVTINSIDWSYDSKYVAIATTTLGGSGNNLHVYSFDGIKLNFEVGFRTVGTAKCVRWHPSSYYIALVNDRTSNQLRVVLYDAALKTLTQSAATSPGSCTGVSWHSRGTFLAVTPASGTTITVYSFNGSSLTSAATRALSPTRTFSNNCICWAPNSTYLAVGSNIITGTPDEELCILYFNGSTTLTVTASAAVDQTINSLDWSQTGTYISMGLAAGSNRISVYAHKVYNGTITSATSVAESTSVVNSVGWNYDGTKLAVGLNNSASVTEFRTYSFNLTTPALTPLSGIESTFNIRAVRYDRTGTYIARCTNQTTNNLEVYQPLDAAYFFQDTNLFLNSDISVQTPLSFKGLSSINGQGNNLIFSGSGGIGILPGAYLTVKNATLKCQKPGIFALQANNSKIKFENSVLWLDSDLTLGDGSFEIFGNVTITGTHTFTYASSYTSTISAFSNLNIVNGAGLKVGQVTTRQPLEFASKTSELNLDNGTLLVTDSGFKITKGNININGQSTFDISYTRTDYGLILGDGANTANDPELNIKEGANLTIANGGFTLNTITNEPIQFSGNTSVLSLNSTSTFAIARNILLDSGYFQPDASSGFLVGSGKTLSTNNTRISYPPKNRTTNEDVYLTGTLSSYGRIYLDDGDSLILNTGSILQTVRAMNGGSQISGIGNFEGSLILNDRLTTVTWDLATQLNGGDTTLNGGRIYFTQDSGVAHGYELLTTGTVKLNGNKFEFGANDTTWTSTLYFDGDNSIIKLNAPLKLTSTWTFSGNIIFDLDRHMLELGPTGNIVIERGSTLECCKATIENYSGSQIRCTDNAGKLIFTNAEICPHTNHLWNKGTLEFHQDNYIYTDKKPGQSVNFEYTSPMTSIIQDSATLRIDSGANFKIGCVNGSPSKQPTAIQPLSFNDVSSTLQLNGGSLTITSSGMTLTKGTLKVTSDSDLYVESNQFDYGLVIGDGTLANDPVFKLDTGARLNIKSGKMFYNNSAATNGLKFVNRESTLRLEAAGALTAKTNLTLQNGTLEFPLSTSTFSTLGSVNFRQENILHRHDSPYSVHRVQADYSVGDYLFGNNDYYYVLEGNTTGSPKYYISGTGFVGGAGVLSNDLTLRNRAVTLKSSLTSGLDASINLNGGTLYLENDLTFAADKKLTGSGSINLNQHKLSFGTEVLTLTDTWYLDTASGINLNAKTNLSSEWAIDGILNLNGHGNILDLSNGGKLRIRPNSTLYLTDTCLKGLGLNGSGFIFMDDTAQLRLDNDFIELESNIQTSIGGVYVEGPTTLGHKNYNWTFDSNGSLTVDGVSLLQDPLGIVNHGKIKFGSGSQSKYLSLVSTGTIKTLSNLDMITTSTTNLAMQIRVNSNYMVRKVYENSNSIALLNLNIRNNSNLLFKLNHDSSNSIRYLDLRVRNDSNAFASYNNGGITIHSTHYTASDDTTLQTLHQFRKGITVAATKTLTLNTPLPVAGNLNFGDGTGKIALQNDLTLGQNTYITSSGKIDGNGYSLLLTSSMYIPTTKVLNFASNTVIDGGFNDFELAPSSALTLDSNTTLTLRNMNLIIKPGSLITLADSSSKLALQNVTLYMDSDFTFNTGSLFVHEDLFVRGTTQFTYSSTNPMFITSNALFYFDEGSKFKYIPGGGTSHASRNLINMSDASSMLYLDGSTLAAPVNGLQLTNGTIILDDRVNFENFMADGTTPNADSTKAITFGNTTAANDINLCVLAGARVEVTGYFDYNNAN